MQTKSLVTDQSIELVSKRPVLSPITLWQTLLEQLFQYHYGLMLSDTPFNDEKVIQHHLDQGISLLDAVNLLVKRAELVRIDLIAAMPSGESCLISAIDILRARHMTGLKSR